MNTAKVLSDKTMEDYLPEETKFENISECYRQLYAGYDQLKKLQEWENTVNYYLREYENATEKELFSFVTVGKAELTNKDFRSEDLKAVLESSKKAIENKKEEASEFIGREKAKLEELEQQ